MRAESVNKKETPWGQGNLCRGVFCVEERERRRKGEGKGGLAKKRGGKGKRKREGEGENGRKKTGPAGPA